MNLNEIDFVRVCIEEEKKVTDQVKKETLGVLVELAATSINQICHFDIEKERENLYRRLLEGLSVNGENFVIDMVKTCYINTFLNSEDSIMHFLNPTQRVAYFKKLLSSVDGEERESIKKACFVE